MPDATSGAFVPDFDPERDLLLDRLLAAPRAAVWRCWEEPGLMRQWFVPAPWRAVEVAMDYRPGGRSRLVMQGPDGEEVASPGVILDAVPGERVVMTDAYSAPWVPAARPFMTAVVTFADEGGGTRYRALARHWSAETRAEHEAMGFHDGWGRAADQLEALARSL